MALSSLSAMFWDKHLWLPVNVSWEDLESNDPKVLYPKAADLYVTPVIGLVLLVLRYLLENFVAEPIGVYLGVRSYAVKVQPNSILEALHGKYGKKTIPHKEITGASKQLDWPEIRVHRWLRKKHLQSAPTNMKKFKECSYQFTFYTVSAIAGLIFMWDKEWLWDTKKCWEEYPRHPITEGTYWYYMIEMGFYFSLLFSIMIDIKRKDFYEMTLHHFVTLALMGFSWSINFSHIGTLVLVVHDVSDPWMQIAKMTKYANMSNVCEVLFVIFAFSWITTRIFYYPLWVINTVWFELDEILGTSFVIKIFVYSLVLLQILHIIWTYYILRVVLQRFTKGQFVHDSRSDSDLTDSDHEDTGKEISNSQNHCSSAEKKEK